MEYGEVKDLDCLPFTPIGVLDYFEKSIRSKKSKINPAHLEKISKEYYNIKKEQRFEKNIHKYLSEKLEVPIATIKECEEYYNECKEFKKKLNHRRVHNTFLEFAKIFDGFPIYFIESFDYRLRMYPYSFMFSRTSGIYKYLVKEYTETELTDNGYLKMLEFFFKDYTEEYKELKEMIHKKENTNIVIEWTNKNIDKIENKTIMKLDSFFYKMLLKKEIKKLQKNEMRTGFMIESDQKSSSFVIAAIIFDDDELAKCSNLNSCEDMDPPRKLMENSSEWFKGKVSDETLKILSSKRNLHKYILMCFLYAQGFGGRRKTILEYGINGKDATYVANKYIEFINVDFEILTKKKDYLIDAVKYFLANSKSPITIDTLDNSRLSWIMFKSLPKKDLTVKKYKSPITGKNVSYRPKNLYIHKRDNRKIVSGLLASYIHSIRWSYYEVNNRGCL